MNVAESQLKLSVENGTATPAAIVTALSTFSRSSLAGKRVTLLGYGSVGSGLARILASCGSRILAVEPDPVRRVIARTHGFEAVDLQALHGALVDADYVISATANRDGSTIGVTEVMLLKDGCCLLNAGSGTGEFAAEIRSPQKRSAHRSEMNVKVVEGHLHIEISKEGKQKTIQILSDGRTINLHHFPGTASDAIDIVFALMLCAAIELSPKKAGVLNLPPEIEKLVAGFCEAPREIRQPLLIAPEQLKAGDRPFGSVTPIAVSGVNGIRSFTIARAVFDAGSTTSGHYHHRSEEVYIAENGEARISVWDPKKTGSAQDFNMSPGQFLVVPEGMAHQVFAKEKFVCLVVACPGFSFWDQFFPNEA